MAPSTVVAELARSERRCVWCGESAADLEPVEVDCLSRWGRRAGLRTFMVQPRYREAFVAHARFVVRYGPWHLPAVIAVLGAMVAGAHFADIRGVGAGLGLLGLLFLALPCATPETVWMLGVRNSIRLVRVIGIVVVLVGLILVATAPRWFSETGWNRGTGVTFDHATHIVTTTFPSGCPSPWWRSASLA